MYTNKLIDAYKDAKRYIQDKQVAHDLNLTPQKLSNVRNGIRYLTESEALFMAEAIGLEAEEVLINLAAEKSKNYKAQQAWANITKKFNGLGLSSISMSCGILAITLEQKLYYALYVLC